MLSDVFSTSMLVGLALADGASAAEDVDDVALGIGAAGPEDVVAAAWDVREVGVLDVIGR